MMSVTKEQITPKIEIWQESTLLWISLLASFCFLIAIYFEGLAFMAELWQHEEYSHAYMLPVVSLFFIWLKKDELATQQLNGSWVGVIALFGGVLLYVVGELSSLYILIQYGFLVALGGLLISQFGLRGFRIIWAAYFLLIFMIPLPNFLQIALSAKLQLISSEIGVMFIRMFGISVFLEGNVIDLGSMKLQVVDACSGLRYLFPLMALSFIAAYLFKAELWKRIAVFLSAIPVTVIMNSIRIGLIGVTVEYWGKAAAEGVLHDFEGWLVFMACTGLLVLEMWLLLKIGKSKIPLSEAFNLEFPVKRKNVSIKPRNLSVQVIAAMVILASALVLSMQLPNREEIRPDRELFSSFPLSFKDWQGENKRLEKIYIDALKFEDYTMINYRLPDQSNNNYVNFYVAYYGSQRKGESAHSPRTCIPGSGWRFTEFDQKIIDNVFVNGKPLQVNRSLIQYGDSRQLVYYWFQQRGRVITNEYLVKLYLFWDGLTRNRSDGALVRLTTNIAPSADTKAADQLLIKFASEVTPLLESYIPN